MLWSFWGMIPCSNNIYLPAIIPITTKHMDEITVF